MTIGDPMGRFAADMDDAARDIGAGIEEPAREASEILADAVRGEAPFVSGYLVSTVAADSEGVGVGAVYAGVVHDSNPYAERAVDSVGDAYLDPFEEHVDDCLDRNIKRIYA